MFKFNTVAEEEMQSIFKKIAPDPKYVIIKNHFKELKNLGIHPCVVSLLPELGFETNNLLVLFKKLLNVDKKAQLAFDSGFYLEWISLVMIKSEFWLRVFLFNKGEYKNKHILSDGLTFGFLINEAKKAKMDRKIINKLFDLNTFRIQYIHNYIKDDFPYESIKSKHLCIQTTVKELEEYAKENCLRIITDPEELENSMGFIKFIRFVK